MDTKNFKNLFRGIGFSNSYENFPDAVIVINIQKNIVSWNKQAQQIFGYSKNDVLGKSINLIFNDEVEKIYKCLGENRSTIITTKTQRGNEVFIEITCADMDTQEGIIIAVRDVSKSRKAIEKILIKYEEAVNASKNKSSFVASLSHELRTPMHSIIGFSQALLDNLGGDLTEKQKKYVAIISKNANNLLALLNGLLDLSKIESGKMEYSLKIFDVVTVINSVIETVNPLILEKNLNFTLDLSDIVKKNIYFDENHLRQILLNILTNAIKFTEIGSINFKVLHPDIEFVKSNEIEVTPEQTDKSFLMFTITDTGIGIPEEDQLLIFDEYRQIDRANSKKYGGTGLGLTIIKKVLKEMGGQIWVESELGEGATFSFILPIERPKYEEG